MEHEEDSNSEDVNSPETTEEIIMDDGEGEPGSSSISLDPSNNLEINQSSEDVNSPETTEEIRMDDGEGEPGSPNISLDPSNNIEINQSPLETRIDVEPGGEPFNVVQVPNDEAGNQESQQLAPFLASNDDTPRGRSSATNTVSDHPQRQGPRPGVRSISVVPPHFLEVDERAYIPEYVSIGPIHHKKVTLFPVEEKKRFVERLFREMSQEDSDTLQTLLKRAMRNMEAQVRRWYSMTLQDMSSDDFVDMLLTDGCFVVRLLCLNYRWYKDGMAGDPIFLTRWVLPNVGRELLIIDNQLPLFVLEKIFKITEFIFTGTSSGTTFKQIALEFIKSYHIGMGEIVIAKRHEQGHHEHLLDLYHSLYLPPKSSRSGAAQERRRKKKPLVVSPIEQRKIWVPSATVLKSCGASFFPKVGNPFEIQFRRGRLRIPSISIDETSIIILKNLLAYEQSFRGIKPLFTSLILFLSSLASVPADIQLLREASIILHQPGDDQMLIELLKLLSKQLECDMGDSSFKKQVEDIRVFYASNFSSFQSSTRRLLAKNAVNLLLLYLSFVVSISVYHFHRLV